MILSQVTRYDESHVANLVNLWWFATAAAAIVAGLGGTDSSWRVGAIELLQSWRLVGDISHLLVRVANLHATCWRRRRRSERAILQLRRRHLFGR